ncbi:hypothetical protein [Spirillospora sp. CA-294931]|uniref:hypothetical protein n=1 Tax=Spirillospora sp. CA-294931 TaxID=3240042 RepID=UPI003D8C94DF
MTRLARANAAPMLALAALALVTTVLAVLVPARTSDGYDRAAGAALGPHADLQVAGLGSGKLTITPEAAAAQMADRSRRWRDQLPPALRTVTGPPEASVTTLDLKSAHQRQFAVSWDPGAERRVRYVAGSAPRNAPGAELQVAISDGAAREFGFRPGTLIEAGGVKARVTGLYAPLDAADRYWTPRAGLLTPQTKEDREVRYRVSVVLADPAGYAALAADGLDLTYSWRFPVHQSEVTAGLAVKMATEVDAFRAAVSGRGDVFPARVSTSLDGVLKSYRTRLEAARTTVGLIQGGLIAAAAGVLLVAAGLLAERLRSSLVLMRARGAAAHQLAVPACGLGVLAVLPAALLGLALGPLLDGGPPGAVPALLAAATALLTCAAPAALLAGRAEAGPTRRRLALEGLVVALAIAGVAMLRLRGPSAGSDPMVAAVPALLGVAAGLLVLRGYPLVSVLAGRLLRRGRSTVAFVAAARAARTPPVTALPLVVLVLTVTVAGFAQSVDGELRRGQERSSWQAVGADARITSDRLEPGAVGRLRAMRGVKGAVPARVRQNVLLDELTYMTVIGVDLAAYRAIAGGAAGDLPSAADGALLSPLAQKLLAPGPVKFAWPGVAASLPRSGVIARFPGQDQSVPFIVVPYKALGAEAYPTTVFIKGDGLDRGTLRNLARAETPAWVQFGREGARAELREDVLRDLGNAPLAAVVHDLYGGGALIAAAYGLMAALAVIIAGAPSRAGARARLRVLGLSGRQGRALAATELLPVIGMTAAAGWTLGHVLPRVAGPLLDLRPYTGGLTAPGGLPEPVPLAVLIAAVLLAGAAAMALDDLADRRRPLAQALRTGDET